MTWVLKKNVSLRVDNMDLADHKKIYIYAVLP